MWTQSVKVLRVDEKGSKKQQDALLLERPFLLSINNQPPISFSINQQYQKEWVLGYLFDQNLISTPEDIQEIKQLDNHFYLTLATESAPTRKEPSQDMRISKYDIFIVMAAFQERALLFKSTAISESLAFSEGADIRVFSEDLNSENVFYKSVGQCLAKGLAFSNLSLISSAKIDLNQIKKASALGVPIVISRTAPTAQAVDFAELENITLVGFARGRRFNVYTHPFRIQGC